MSPNPAFKSEKKKPIQRTQHYFNYTGERLKGPIKNWINTLKKKQQKTVYKTRYNISGDITYHRLSGFKTCMYSEKTNQL